MDLPRHAGTVYSRHAGTVHSQSNTDRVQHNKSLTYLGMLGLFTVKVTLTECSIINHRLTSACWACLQSK